MEKFYYYIRNSTLADGEIDFDDVTLARGPEQGGPLFPLGREQTDIACRFFGLWIPFFCLRGMDEAEEPVVFLHRSR
jgi:hypothetical protein